MEKIGLACFINKQSLSRLSVIYFIGCPTSSSVILAFQLVADGAFSATPLPHHRWTIERRWACQSSRFWELSRPRDLFVVWWNDEKEILVNRIKDLRLERGRHRGLRERLTYLRIQASWQRLKRRRPWPGSIWIQRYQLDGIRWRRTHRRCNLLE